MLTVPDQSTSVAGFNESLSFYPFEHFSLAAPVPPVVHLGQLQAVRGAGNKGLGFACLRTSFVLEVGGLALNTSTMALCNRFWSLIRFQPVRFQRFAKSQILLQEMRLARPETQLVSISQYRAAPPFHFHSSLLKFKSTIVGILPYGIS